MTTYSVARAGVRAYITASSRDEAIRIADEDYNRPPAQRTEDWKDSEYTGEEYDVHEADTEALTYYDVIVSWRTSGRVPVLATSAEEAQEIARTLAITGQGIMHDVMPYEDGITIEHTMPGQESEAQDADANRAEALNE